jgi:hypothetical protein
MKKLIAIACLLISIHSVSQGNQDSLSKYSYQVFGFTPPKYSFFGTGFFIKNKNSLYFITAKHVLTGCTHGNQFGHFPNKMNVMIDSGRHSFYINTTEIINSNPCHYSFFD